MEKELLELVESEINFHGECSSQMIEELLLFFKDREDTAIYIPSTGLYGYMRVKEYLSFFANLTNHRNLLEPAIEFMHLSDIGTMKLSQCTESQKVRVLIARLILLDCHTIFMIEPLRDLEAVSYTHLFVAALITFSEFFTRKLAQQHSESIALAFTSTQKFFVIILTPFVALLTLLANIFLKLFRQKTDIEYNGYSEEQVMSKMCIRDRYMQAEMRFSLMMNDVYKILGEVMGLGNIG